MITINLLPAELRPIKRTPLPYIVVLAIAVGAGLFCTQMFLKDLYDLNTIKETKVKNEAALATHKENIEKYKVLVQKKKNLAAKLNTINDIASDRIIWSIHLSSLANLAPENLWYENIEETTRTITETIMILDQKTGKSKPKKIKKYIPVLKLTGCISTDDTGQLRITPFLASLDTDEEFSNMFEMEPPTLNYKKVDNDNVRTFVLNCVIAPKAGEVK